MAGRPDLPIEEQRSGPASRIAGWLERGAFVVGAIGLLAAMFTDALAVLGRHVGLPFLGSIEIMQSCVVLAASAAMVGATLRGSHARVHLLVDRVTPAARQVLQRVADGLSAVVFWIFAVGSVWIAMELWYGHELSELLHIPFRWLRVLWIASALLIAIVLTSKAFFPRERAL